MKMGQVKKPVHMEVSFELVTWLIKDPARVRGYPESPQQGLGSLKCLAS